MTTACPDCEAAAKEVWHSFRASCSGCAARATSRGPLFHQARRQGRQPQLYREHLARLGLTHDQVKAAANADAAQRNNATRTGEQP